MEFAIRSPYGITHADRTPFWIALAGSGAALGGLYIAPWVVVGGMLLFLAGSIIDYRNGRRASCRRPMP